MNKSIFRSPGMNRIESEYRQPITIEMINLLDLILDEDCGFTVQEFIWATEKEQKALVRSVKIKKILEDNDTT
jgi:hypothetical protein